MVHELFGITNNRVAMASVPGVKSRDLQEIVLAVHQDEFFATNWHTNFGDLCMRVKELVDGYQAKHKSHENIQTIADMQRFVEHYPEYRRMAGNVSKHVTVVSEISRIIEEESLMEVSAVEQQLACAENHSDAVKKVFEVLMHPRVTLDHKVRVVALFALHYESQGRIDLESMIDRLKLLGVDPPRLRVINDLLEYAGASKRGADLFSSKNIFVSFTKTFHRELLGASNIYTEHKPLLDNILEQISKNRLKETLYPYLDSHSRDRPQDVIIFFVGGTTFEEALCVDQFNKNNPNMRVVLGGTTIHNCKSFLGALKSGLGVFDVPH
eukprot:c9555_g1_i3.p1 GENE.c9555_g1_i3~~c9555_g1_i3.p1  ORF type:complete len:325 (-),score=67.17 c9555_g1_i3:1-975(-)